MGTEIIAVGVVEKAGILLLLETSSAATHALMLSALEYMRRCMSLRQSQAWPGQAAPCWLLCPAATTSCAPYLSSTISLGAAWPHPQQQVVVLGALLLVCSTS